jgi:hypothetical protein
VEGADRKLQRRHDAPDARILERPDTNLRRFAIVVSPGCSPVVGILARERGCWKFNHPTVSAWLGRSLITIIAPGRMQEKVG